MLYGAQETTAVGSTTSTRRMGIRRSPFGDVRLCEQAIIRLRSSTQYHTIQGRNSTPRPADTPLERGITCIWKNFGYNQVRTVIKGFI